MRFKAVVFDLFGTVVDEDGDRTTQMFEEICQLWDVPSDSFQKPWHDTRRMRRTGAFKTLREQFDYVCSDLGITPSRGDMANAEQLFMDTRMRTLEPRLGSLETLQALKAMGLLRGLVSNCSSWDCDLWNRSELAPHIDAPVLSAAVGLIKPDRRIFQLACKRLGVLPEECLYVGDGGNDELTAAKAMGMQAVLIQVPYGDAPWVNEEREGKDWGGPRIASIPEVMGLLG